jgi:hypothetical protein
VEAVWVPVVVALIGGPVMWALHRFDKRNTEQHGANMRVLGEIRDDVKTVRRRLDKHIDWHAHTEE